MSDELMSYDEALERFDPALGEAVMYRVAAAYEASRPFPSAPEVSP